MGVKAASRRLARLFGRELRPVLPPDLACMARLQELRRGLRELDEERRGFIRFCLENLEHSRSDTFQDLFVLHETGGKRGGFFVEFGAADGVAGSNTYALESGFGWTGIVAEPALCWHDALGRNRACTVDHRCVTDRSGETILFRECVAPANSTIDRFAGTYPFDDARRPGFTRYPVTTVSLNDLLSEHGAPAEFDYLSIDTEGSELMILAAADLRAFRPRIITVEHCHSPARAALHDLLTARGYRRRHEALSQFDDWYARA